MNKLYPPSDTANTTTGLWLTSSMYSMYVDLVYKSSTMHHVHSVL